MGDHRPLISPVIINLGTMIPIGYYDWVFVCLSVYTYYSNFALLQIHCGSAIGPVIIKLGNMIPHPRKKKRINQSEPWCSAGATTES